MLAMGGNNALSKLLQFSGRELRVVASSLLSQYGLSYGWKCSTKFKLFNSVNRVIGLRQEEFCKTSSLPPRGTEGEKAVMRNST